MADRDHIAITSGDASTTRRKVSVPGCPVAPPIAVTEGDFSDTYRRIAADSGILSGEYRPAIPPAGRTCLASRPQAAPAYSVRLLEVGERAPAAAGALVHRHGELALAPGGSVDGGADLGHRLVRAECVVTRQVDEPAVVEFHQ